MNFKGEEISDVKNDGKYFLRLICHGVNGSSACGALPCAKHSSGKYCVFFYVDVFVNSMKRVYNELG